jgi:hypothetical protein
VDPRSIEHVRTQFEMAGELLPLPCDGVELTVLNVLECINCLDHERSTWLTTKDGQRIYPDPFKKGSYVFHAERLPESSLFKIPELRQGRVLCRERDGDPELEFKAAVELHGLVGLKFQLLWQT